MEAKKIKTVCYYTNWSQYRTGEGKFFPENIDENLCTHLIYAFAKLDGNRIIAQEWNDESTRWSKGIFNSLKKKNSELRTLLAIGGWNAGSGPFSRMVATSQDRREFVQSTISYLRRWDFDGLDIDWEYPTKRGGVIQDKERFKLLLQTIN
ncbi:hypothetical protein KUTeg_001144 [Tegillarca granosa]|uniref:GH18 domain-containing protein n=1 Tax=Tegillarca granosa TaxID=220873 RepID=A0ABQ9FX30_TEGGR|nr:hypothetical protein KUTeg_001144 [Tegillarca granosa]